MSLINKIKNVFGFGVDEYPDSENNPRGDQLPEPPQQMPTVEYTDEPIEVSEEMMHRIFDKVVEVTNAALPGYLQSSVDPNRQKKYLYDSLDASVKEYLRELDARSQAKCMALWQNERNDLNDQMLQLKQRAAELETKRTEMNEQRLSIENQKRALTDQVNILNEKVLKLEAEKEQYEIENRGLLNKAKVAQVHEEDMEAMRQELEQLRATATPEACSEEMDRLHNQIAHLEQQNQQLNEGCEAAKLKSQMSDAMVKDLQKRTAEMQQKMKDKEQQISELDEEKGVLEARITDMQNIISEKDARLAEDDKAFEDIEALMQQVEQFEKIKNKFEEKIVKLNEELKEAQKENETLRTTIKTNLATHAQQEQVMKDALEKMRTSAMTPISGDDLPFDTDAL